MKKRRGSEKYKNLVCTIKHNRVTCMIFPIVQKPQDALDKKPVKIGCLS